MREFGYYLRVDVMVVISFVFMVLYSVFFFLVVLVDMYIFIIVVVVIMVVVLVLLLLVVVFVLVLVFKKFLMFYEKVVVVLWVVGYYGVILGFFDSFGESVVIKEGIILFVLDDGVFDGLNMNFF